MLVKGANGVFSYMQKAIWMYGPSIKHIYFVMKSAFQIYVACQAYIE